MLRVFSVILLFVMLIGCDSPAAPEQVSNAPSVAGTNETSNVDGSLAEESVAERAFMQIAERYGDLVDVPALPLEQRNLFLVCHIDATLEAGGFDFLFDADGDPHYGLILQAYDAVGAAHGKKAIETAYKTFEGGQPPQDRQERMQKWNSRTVGVDLNELYSTARAEVRVALEEYAKKHQSQLITN